MKHDEVLKRLETIRDWTQIILDDCYTAQRDLDEMMTCLNSMIDEKDFYDCINAGIKENGEW